MASDSNIATETADERGGKTGQRSRREDAEQDVPRRRAKAATRRERAEPAATTTAPKCQAGVPDADDATSRATAAAPAAAPSGFTSTPSLPLQPEREQERRKLTMPIRLPVAASTMPLPQLGGASAPGHEATIMLGSADRDAAAR
jgi:hypothetical protein